MIYDIYGTVQKKTKTCLGRDSQSCNGSGFETVSHIDQALRGSKLRWGRKGLEVKHRSLPGEGPAMGSFHL